MAKKTFPLSEVYRLLEPGPVVMVTTARKGKANIMTMSWQTMMEFVPPLVGCVISGRNYSFDALVATKECVLNIPAVEIAKQVVGVGNCSGSKVDKFKKFKLTPMPAAKVAAAAHRRVFRQSRMQGGRYPHGEQVQLLRAGGGQGLDRSCAEESAHAASSGQGHFCGGWGQDQAAFEDGVMRIRVFNCLVRDAGGRHDQWRLARPDLWQACFPHCSRTSFPA